MKQLMSNLKVVDGDKALDAEKYGDFTVDELTGLAFISQTKTSELTGIDRSTLRDWIKYGIQKGDLSVNENNQLDAESFRKVVKYGTLKGYREASDLLDMLLEAGVKAFIYHEAGYQMDATPRQPETRAELAKKQYELLLELENAGKEVERLNIQLDETTEYATIKRMEKAYNREFNWRVLKKVGIQLRIERKDVFDQNCGTVKSYHKDTWMEAYGLDIK